MLPTKRSSPSLTQDMRGHDLSGRDLTGVRARDYNFFEAIFNGCNLRRWRVTESVFQHADFAETHIIDCSFEASSFDHSDFVAAEVRDSVFRRCTFQNAEWRDVTFVNVRFQQCVFRNTTTTLAKFINCTFDRSSSNSFIGHSKRYNTFAGSTFHLPPRDIGFLRLNFGIRSTDATDRVDAELATDSLFSAAIDYYNRLPVAGPTMRKLVTTFHAMIESSPPQSPFLVKYAANICDALIASSELSVLAMQYLHDAIHDKFNAIRDTGILLDVVAFLTLLRLKLRERIAEIEDDVRTFYDAPTSPVRCRLVFEARFPEYATREFANVFAQFCGHPAEAVQIESYAVSSTFVEMILEVATPLVTVIRYLRYALAQMALTVESGTRFKRQVAGLLATSPKSVGVTKIAKKKQASRPRKKASGQALVRTPEAASARILKIPAVDVLGPPTGEAKDVQVVVRVVREQAIAVGGRVEVTVLLQ